MNTSQKVDRLGEVLALQADLEREAKELKADLMVEIPAGSALEGSIFRASHSQAERNSVAWKTIAERLEASRQMIVANTTKKVVDTIKVVSRQG